MITVGSLFAGIGGFDVAAERRGMRVQWQIEIDRFARRVLARHWPDVRRYEDIRAVDAAALEPVDLLCGGWPCQGNSVAGKRQGHADERSGLFGEILRLVDGMAARPRFLCLENVPGLVSVNGGGDFRAVIHEFQRRGYVGCVRRLDAQYFGLAQRRQRLFFVAGLGSAGLRAVQLVLEGGERYPAPRREAREGVAAPVKASAPSRRNGGSWPVAEEFVAGSIGAGSGGWCSDTERMTFIPEDAGRVPFAAARQTGRGYWNGDGLAGLRAHRGGVAENLVAVTLLGKPNSSHDESKETYIAFSSKDDGGDAESALSPTLRAGSHDKSHANAGVPPAVAYSLGSHAGAAEGDATNRSHAAGGPVGSGISEERSHSLRAGRTQAVAFGISSDALDRSGEGAAQNAAERAGLGVVEEASPSIRARHPNAVAFIERGREQGRTLESQEELAYALTNPGSGGRTHSRQIQTGAQVWRLTPTECERLQGFPDGWTCLCGRNDGRSVGTDPCVCADGPRYKSLGNAVAIPPVEWLMACMVAAAGEVEA